MNTAYQSSARHRQPTDTSAPASVTQWVKASRRGDLSAFEQLYRRYAKRVYGVCRRLVDSDWEAEEMTQRTFVQAWAKLDSYRGASRFGTWLHRIAVNQVLSERRTRWARDVEALEASTETALALAAPSPSRLAAHRFDLDAAIRTLPPGSRQILVLHDIEGYTHAEIAELLGVAVGTSKAQLSRARRLMRRYLR